MSRTRKNNLFFSASIFDADADALFSRMTTQPTSDRKVLISNFISGIKADLSISLLSDAFDCLWFLAAHDQQAARLNWVKPAHNLTEVNNPIFEIDRGYTGNGSTSYLDTNYNPVSQAVNFSQNNGTAAVYSRSNITDFNSDFGGGLNFTVNIISRYATGGNAFAAINQATFGNNNFPTPNSLGLLQGKRTIGSNSEIHKNGIFLGLTDVASGSPDSFSYFILGLNLGGSLFNPSQRQIAMAMVGKGSLITPISFFYRTETFLDAIGAGVVA